jgi:hypothetical protein
MMSLIVAVSLASFALSGALLMLLGLRDPKRLRNSRTRATPLPVATRRMLAYAALIPGVVLIGIGQWWAFLIWLGATCIAGWGSAQFLARRSVSY